MIEGELDREGDGVYDRMNGIGAHEVIVETPDHTQALLAICRSRRSRACSAPIATACSTCKRDSASATS